MAEHKTLPKTALLPPPEAAKADPSPHPAPQGAVPGSGSAGLSAGSCSRLQTLQQLTANPRGRGFSAPNKTAGWTLQPPLPAPLLLEFNTQQTSSSAPSLQPWKEQWFTAETAVPSGLQGLGMSQGGDTWERRIYGSGYGWWERGKGIPLLLEQRKPVRTGRCCRKHNGSQHPSEEGTAPFSLAATHAQSVINPQNGFFFFKNRPCPPTGSLNKSLAPVLFSSRSPGSAALSLQHWYFSTSAESSEPQGCGHRCAPWLCPLQVASGLSLGNFWTTVWLSVTGLWDYKSWSAVTKLS